MAASQERQEKARDGGQEGVGGGTAPALTDENLRLQSRHERMLHGAGRLQ